MFITVKTLKQETFKVEVEESDKVLSIKEKIEKLQGHPVSSQKLIFSGKILEDEKPVAHYNISEKDFLVIMVTKAKSAATSTSKPAATPDAATTSSAPAAPAAVTPSAPVAQTSTEQMPAAAPSNAPVVGENPTPAASAEPAPPSDDNALLTGARFETAIQNMMEMGFPRDQCMQAMRASFNNPDRAVEYLMTGIPEHLQAHANAPAAAAPTRAAAPASTTAPTSTPSTTAATTPPTTTPAQPQNLFTAAAQAAADARRGGAGAPGAEAGAADTESLAFLRDQPQFQQIREMVQNNPDLLQPLLIQLGQSNPQMLQLINQNQQAFLQLLNEGNEGDDGHAGGDARIYVTQEEQEAIQRLENLGFDHRTVVEAFLACDRDEQMAANYLFDHGHDDMEEEFQ
ncbi:hypothetical protein BGX28_006515 [Mortierella sp. GBA30]|nr:hypothetical protein BGX28_006515 [Mortierella sp. GBA30]